LVKVIKEKSFKQLTRKQGKFTPLKSFQLSLSKSKNKFNMYSTKK